jgi:hypothetical protein
MNKPSGQCLEGFFYLMLLEDLLLVFHKQEDNDRKARCPNYRTG